MPLPLLPPPPTFRDMLWQARSEARRCRSEGENFWENHKSTDADMCVLGSAGEQRRGKRKRAAHSLPAAAGPSAGAAPNVRHLPHEQQPVDQGSGAGLRQR